MQVNQSATVSANAITLDATSLRGIMFLFLFLGATVLLPVVSHLAGLPVRYLLPMHWPVILGALVYGWRGGAAVGAIAPTVSYLLSGMPLPVILPAMSVELLAYGAVVGMVRESFRLNPFISVLLGLVTGRIVFVLAVVLTGAHSIGEVGYFEHALLPGILPAIAQVAILPLAAKWWIAKQS